MTTEALGIWVYAGALLLIAALLFEQAFFARKARAQRGKRAIGQYVSNPGYRLWVNKREIAVDSWKEGEER